MFKKGGVFLFALLLIHLGLLVNIRFTAWPEMFSFPYLFSKGFKIYSDFIHPYPPLLTILLTIFYKLLGFKIITLKIVSWLIIIASDIFLFLIINRVLKKEFLSFLILIPYIISQSFLDGNMLWFDNALVLPIVAAVYFLYKWFKKKKKSDLIWSTIFLTAGVFIKQTAVIYFLSSLIFIFFVSKAKRKELREFLLIPVVSGLAFLGHLLLAGNLKDFVLWVFYYPLTFWSKFPGYQDLALSLQEKAVLLLFILPLLGAILLRKKILKDKFSFLAILFLVASLISVYPRFSYFHLQPFIAISFIAFTIIFSYLKKNWYIALLWIFSIASIYPTLNSSFIKSVRFFDEDDQKVVNMISSLSNKNEKVYLVGLFSSAYPFSDRVPPKPWVDNFGWYWEIPKEADKILSRFELDPPSKIFYKVPERGNWFDLGVYRPQKLVNYMHEHYYRDSEPIGGVELWKRKK